MKQISLEQFKMSMKSNRSPYDSPLSVVSEELYECAKELKNAYCNIVMLYSLLEEVTPYPVQSSADKIKEISAQLLTHSKILNSLNYERF